MFSLFATLLRAALLPPGRRRRGVPRAGGVAVGPRDRRPAAARPDRRRQGPAAGRQPDVVGRLGRPQRARQDDRAPAGPAARPGRRRRRRPCRIRELSPAARRQRGGTAGTARRTSRSRSPPTSRSGSRCGSSSSPRTTRRWSPSSRACAPTRSRTASTSRTCSATSARSPRGSTTGRRRTTTRRVNGASSVGRAGVEKEYDRWLRGMPGYQSVAVDSMGRVLGDDGEVAGEPGDTLVTSIDARVQARGRAAARADHPDRAGDPRHGHRPQLRRRLRRRDRDGGRHRPDRRDGQPADVRPGGLGRRHHQEAARPALLRGGRHPAARPGHPGPVRARARRGSRS